MVYKYILCVCARILMCVTQNAMFTWTIEDKTSNSSHSGDRTPRKMATEESEKKKKLGEDGYRNLEHTVLPDCKNMLGSHILLLLLLILLWVFYEELLF